MTIVFMTTSGILQYDMTGYYLFVCMLYVIVIFLVDMGHCYYYSTEIFVVDYDRYHCLLPMIYVLGLAIYSKLCRGVYAVMLFTPLHIVITNVHDPDLILIVYICCQLLAVSRR